MIFILALLVTYAIILLIGITNGAPTIKTELRWEMNIPPPSVCFQFPYNFTIDCESHNMDVAQNCSQQHVEQPTFIVSSNRYSGCFIPNGVQVTKDVIYSLAYTVNDTNFNNSSPVPELVATIYDTELISTEYNETAKEVDRYYPSLINSFNAMSIYLLFYQQANIVEYSRSERHVIRRNAFTAFGMLSNNIRVPYITTKIQGGPLNISDLDANIYGALFLKVNNNVVRVEIEQRRVISSIGLLGGAWGLAVGLYAILFGSDSLRPWGCIHFYCCCFIRQTRLQLRESLPVIPLRSSKSSTVLPAGSYRSKDSKSVEQLQERLDRLELFMREYMVESAYLEGLNENRFPNRLSSWLGGCTGNSGTVAADTTGVYASISSVSHSKTDVEDATRTTALERERSIIPSDHTRVSTSPQPSPSRLSNPDFFFVDAESS
ncbi:9360_t:CDS:2 [Paraglomus brasilianum]|uniref:9360_t:CDS:1 n=1 Tax=Paraglomus brasilianum TaxID=144538 RepID=A0A9N9GR08_9GLOM|nr:9360_t:CDS:2 [Paraglomus brasilianum]